MSLEECHSGHLTLYGERFSSTIQNVVNFSQHNSSSPPVCNTFFESESRLVCDMIIEDNVEAGIWSVIVWSNMRSTLENVNISVLPVVGHVTFDKTVCVSGNESLTLTRCSSGDLTFHGAHFADVIVTITGGDGSDAVCNVSVVDVRTFVCKLLVPKSAAASEREMVVSCRGMIANNIVLLIIKPEIAYVQGTCYVVEDSENALTFQVSYI